MAPAYHLIAREHRDYRWWRPLLEIITMALVAVVFVLVTFGLGAAAAAATGVAMVDGWFSDPIWELSFLFTVVAVLLPAVLLVVRWVGRRRPGSVSSVEGRVRWRWLVECGGWSLAAGGLVLAAAAATGERWQASLWPGWDTFATVGIVIVLIVPFQSAAEEYLCRGWLLQLVSSWTRVWWPAALAGTALFVLLHDYTDPLVILDLTVFSLAMCWLTVRTSGIEAAVALHAANNVVGLLAASTQGLPDLSQTGDYTAAQVLPSTVVILLYTWWIDRRARRTRLVLRRIDRFSLQSR